MPKFEHLGWKFKKRKLVENSSPPILKFWIDSGRFGWFWLVPGFSKFAFSYMTLKSLRQKFKYLKNEKSF